VTIRWSLARRTESTTHHTPLAANEGNASFKMFPDQSESSEYCVSFEVSKLVPLGSNECSKSASFALRSTSLKATSHPLLKIPEVFA
jgi:hypothetical protein